ncbi:MAG TPA: PhzF family phenazine biosynthesis protein [Chthoniobacteraceae bacterium]|nr:PhzF family phenazine biosynthesis protein [Chthoniobacteraceae bacterium]
MRIPYYQVDAFTDRVFSGNPAGVCLLESWLPDGTLQQIALENNLSETAFVVRRDDEFDLRWMTPTMEIDLCGHATLAPAFIIFTELGYAGQAIRFNTKTGPLGATRDGPRIVLDFPSWEAKPCEVPALLADALGWIPRELYRNRDYLAVLTSERELLSLKPDMTTLAQLECLGVICTAPGEDCDFVSRFFAPGAGIPEDPVTGSAHSTLTPYWAKRLGKSKLHARQLSARRGELWLEDRGARVGIGGECALYSRAEIEVPAV